MKKLDKEVEKPFANCYYAGAYKTSEKGLSMNDTTRQSVLFPEFFSKPVHVVFSREQLSSNGGVLLLAARDRQLGADPVADRLSDRHQAAKVDHELGEQIRSFPPLVGQFSG